MHKDTKRIMEQVADDISKGVVSYDRARRQLVEWARAKPTIDIGEAIDWLDRNVNKVKYEDVEADGVTIAEKVDITHYYDHGKAANRAIMAEARQHPMIAGTNIPSEDVAKANQRVIDVTARVSELTGRADEEMGVVDVDES